MAYFSQPITVTAATTLNVDSHAGNIVVLDSTTGRIITLPASTGKGDVYTVLIKTTVSSGNHVVAVANSTDVMQGSVGMVVGVAGALALTASTSDTITMNGTATGGVFGSWVRLTDVAAGFWMLEGNLNCTTTGTTPFSAAV